MKEIPTRDVVVRLTQAAANKVRHLQAADSDHAGCPLRVHIEDGGCSGIEYNMLFDERRADDIEAEFFGVKVVVDPFSAKYLRGAVIDFREDGKGGVSEGRNPECWPFTPRRWDDLNDGGFEVLNPNARERCRCGKSFEAIDQPELAS